jgi:hypothetical protein
MVSWQAALDPRLLNPASDAAAVDAAFESSLNAHGKYETMRFVLSLSPENHRHLEKLETGVYNGGYLSSETLQAYSTYLHETVHWWQHVGSTSGLVFSLCYLGQSHASLTNLRAVLKKFGAKKSLKRWTDNTLLREGAQAQGKLADANIAVNNALDVEYYKLYAMWPPEKARILFGETHFECVGHSYAIVYGQLLGMISSVIDMDFIFIPNAPSWDDNFKRLSDEKHEGFFHGSPLRVPPVGLHAIYEGQARFIQLQFLDGSQSEALPTKSWREMGYLSGIYVQAFEVFLEQTGSDWPETLRDPLVDLFLLVCDLAINPTRGFPLPIESFEDFIRDVDVGVRFTLLSQAVRGLPHLKGAIKDHSKNEYVTVAEELTERAGYDHPLAALSEISKWMEEEDAVKRLMEEHTTFEFDNTNLPIRVFLSHFLSLSRDRLERPEFFCWPGAWMAGAGPVETTKEIWLRHLSLFSDRGDKPGVYPRRWPDRDDKAVKLMFDRFYGTMALYDLTRQWILRDGPFECDYRWLFENYSQEKANAWANETFKKVYGVALDDFEILPTT